MGSSSAVRSACQRVLPPNGAHMLPEPSMTNRMSGVVADVLTIASAQSVLRRPPLPVDAEPPLRPPALLRPAVPLGIPKPPAPVPVPPTAPRAALPKGFGGGRPLIPITASPQALKAKTSSTQLARDPWVGTKDSIKNLLTHTLTC